MFTNPQQYANPYMTRTGNSINWVQGIEGAKAFQLMPNSNCMMLDSERDGIFYIKTSDNVGMCNLRIFKFQEVTEQKTQSIDPDEFVRKSELESLLNAMLGGTTNEQSVSATKPDKQIITK